MWIELRLQCGEAGAGELLRKSCYLHFALARVDEVTRRMLDPDYAKVNSDTKRQRDEDPTQPFNTDAQPELCGAILHRFVIKPGREEPHKQHTQYLTTRRPSHTEHDRHEQMKQDAPAETRAREWPPFRDREDKRSEKRVEQPVAKFEKQFASCCRLPTAKSRLCEPVDNSKRGWNDPGC